MHAAILLLFGAFGLPRGDAQQAVIASQTVAARESASGARALTLTQLSADPGRYLGEDVRFVLQFRGLVEDWDPFLSRFEPTRWLALEVWPDEAFTWDRATFESPARRLFVRRGGGFEPLARRARTYQRYEARVRVREVFLGEPWLELLGLVPLEGEVGEGTLLHVTRARELVAEGKLDLALEQYERARKGPLPPHALAAVLDEQRRTQEARELQRAEEAKRAPRQ